MNQIETKLTELSQEAAALQRQLQNLKNPPENQQVADLKRQLLQFQTRLGSTEGKVEVLQGQLSELKSSGTISDAEFTKLGEGIVNLRRGIAAQIEEAAALGLQWKEERTEAGANVDAPERADGGDAGGGGDGDADAASSDSGPRHPRRPIRDEAPMFIIVVVLLVIGYSVLFEKGVVPHLSDSAFARGLITFIISVGTIGLAFFLAYQAFAVRDGTADETFRRAREVFTGLMGVLGTIVGFYFGAAEKSPADLQVAAIKLTDSQIMTHISGGTQPYRYIVKSTDSDFREIKGTSDGWIVERLSKQLKPGSTLTIEVLDSREQKKDVKMELPDLSSTTSQKGQPADSTNAPK